MDPGIHSSIFDACYTAQKNSILQLSFETQSSYRQILFFACLFVYLLVFAFGQIPSHWNSLAVAFSAMKFKRCLHVSYM